jgi:WS/DGAT/MGAT family acyltransferase
MEDPTNLMMITGIFTFDETIEFQRLKKLLEKRLLRFDRFRQRIIQPYPSIRPAYWEIDPTFNMNAHVHKIALPAPGDQDTLQELVNDFMSSPLDFSKPLWQIHLVENYGNGCALLCRLHHSIADGIALMRVLLALTDDEADPPTTNNSDHSLSEGHRNSESRTNALTPRISPHAPRRYPRAEFGRYRKETQKIIKKGAQSIGDPEKSGRALKFGVESAGAFAHLVSLSPDPQTTFKGKLGVQKRCAWSRPIPLSDVKAVSKVCGGTINDILLSAVAGALGRYLRRKGEPIGGLNIRAVVPVNLRPPDEPLRLGNAFGLVFLSLPVGISDPLERLNELKRGMDKIKGTPEAMVAFGILAAIGAATSTIQDFVLKLFAIKATAVMTNVPGPREDRFFAGKPIKDLMFWVPQSGKLGLGVSILSYSGKVYLGVVTDAGLVPEPQAILDEFYNEMSDYVKLVRNSTNTI